MSFIFEKMKTILHHSVTIKRQRQTGQGTNPPTETACAVLKCILGKVIIELSFVQKKYLIVI